MTEYTDAQVRELMTTIADLEREKKRLFIALSRLCHETRKAHADRNNLTPGCAVCDAIKWGEKTIAAIPSPE